LKVCKEVAIRNWLTKKLKNNCYWINPGIAGRLIRVWDLREQMKAPPIVSRSKSQMRGFHEICFRLILGWWKLAKISVIYFWESNPAFVPYRALKNHNMPEWHKILKSRLLY
jgi:hypothetical protein